MSKTKKIKRARREQRAAALANEEFNAVRPIGIVEPKRVNTNPLSHLGYTGAPVDSKTMADYAEREALLTPLVNIGSEKYPVFSSSVDTSAEQEALMGCAFVFDEMQAQNIAGMIENAVCLRVDPYHSINQDLTEVYLALHGMGVVGAACTNPMEYNDWNIGVPTQGGISWNDVYPKFWQRQYQRLRHACKLPLSSEMPCTYRATTLTLVLNSLHQTRVTFTVKQYHDGRAPAVSFLVHSK